MRDSRRIRLDQALVSRKLVSTRSQAESWIKLGKVTVDGRVVTKSGVFVANTADIKLTASERYVSRAGLKLASVVRVLELDFADKTVLDVGSSTGGFTDYALQHGAKFVYAVDVGTDQLHPSLQGHPKIELHEKTDIRAFKPDQMPDIIVIDVSFISLREILPHLATISVPKTIVVAMVKPQFEASRAELGSNGVVKNDSIRRDILKNFEAWAKRTWLIKSKADSEVAGSTGNRERFYLLQHSA